MTWFSHALVRQVLALSILLFLVASTFFFVIQTVVELPRSRSADIASLSEQLDDLRSGAARDAGLRQRQLHASAALQALSAFWTGPSRIQIAAAIQDVLRSAAQQAGGQVVSTSVLDDHGGNLLAVRARIDGTMATMQHVLAAIEANRPRLFVDSLVVTAPSGPSTAAHPQALSLELSASLYIASGSHAEP